MNQPASKVSRFPRPKSITHLLPCHRDQLDGISRAFTVVRNLDDARCIVCGIEVGAQGGVTIRLTRAPEPGFVGGQHEIVIAEGMRKVRIVRALYQGVTLEWRAPEYRVDPNSELDAAGQTERN